MMTIAQALDALLDVHVHQNPGVDAVPVNEDAHEWIDWIKVRRADGQQIHVGHDTVPPAIFEALTTDPAATMAAVAARRAASAQAVACYTEVLQAFERMAGGRG